MNGEMGGGWDLITARFGDECKSDYLNTGWQPVYISNNSNPRLPPH